MAKIAEAKAFHNDKEKMFGNIKKKDQKKLGAADPSNIVVQSKDSNHGLKSLAKYLNKTLQS